MYISNLTAFPEWCGFSFSNSYYSKPLSTTELFSNFELNQDTIPGNPEDTLIKSSSDTDNAKDEDPYISRLSLKVLDAMSRSLDNLAFA